MTPRLILGLSCGALLAAACGTPKAPDLAQRETTEIGPPAYGPPPDYTNADDSDAGLYPADAGPCCPVRFALQRRAGEVSGELDLLSHAGNFPLRDDDAGVWSVDLCMHLVPDRYYFTVGYALDQADAGLFLMHRVNDAVPQELNAVVDQVNVFDPGAAATCAELDAGAYAALPDAGP